MINNRVCTAIAGTYSTVSYVIMSQDSILELLSVTNNAVRALDRTSSTKSSGSVSGGATPRETWRSEDEENQPPLVPGQDLHDHSRSSGDSGVGKTYTQSNKPSDRRSADPAMMHDSDDSTTASDVLIRSTLADNEPNMPSATSRMDSSVTAQGFHSEENHNFNVAENKKTQASKKHVKMVSPEDSFAGKPVNGTDTYENVNNNRPKNQHADTDFKSETGKIINGYPGKNIPGVSAKPILESGSSKNFPGQQKVLKQGLDSSISAYTVERHERGRSKMATKQFQSYASEQQLGKGQLKKPSSSALFPYKESRSGKEQSFVEQEEPVRDWDGKFIYINCSV